MRMNDQTNPSGSRMHTNLAWTAGGRVTSEGLRVGGHLLLTRLLPPEAFGLFLILNTFVQGLTAFSDVGINASIIQNKSGEQRAFLDTAWTLQVARGFLLWTLCFIAAPFVAEFYDQPDLSFFIPIGAISLIFVGFTSPALPLLQRRLNLKRWVVVDVIAQSSAVLLMVALAWFTQSVWALIAGALATTFTLLVISHTIDPSYRPKFGWHADAARALIGFGVWILINTPLGWLADNADRLAMGRLVPLDILGVFQIASMIGGMPFRLLSAVAGNVVFPTFSNAIHTGLNLRSVYLQLEHAVLVLGALMVCGLVAFGPPAIDLLLEPRWHDAAAMLVPIAASQWFRIAAITPANALFSLGYPQYLVLGNLAKLVGYILFIPVFLLNAGGEEIIITALWGFAAGEAMAPLLYRILLRWHVPSVGWEEYRIVFLLAISCSIIVIGSTWLEENGVNLFGRASFGALIMAIFWGHSAVYGARAILQLTQKKRPTAAQ